MSSYGLEDVEEGRSDGLRLWWRLSSLSSFNSKGKTPEAGISGCENRPLTSVTSWQGSWIGFSESLGGGGGMGETNQLLGLAAIKVQWTVSHPVVGVEKGKGELLCDLCYSQTPLCAATLANAL